MNKAEKKKLPLFKIVQWKMKKIIEGFPKKQTLFNNNDIKIKKNK